MSLHLTCRRSPARPVTQDELITGGISAKRIRVIAEQIDLADRERRAMRADIKALYREAEVEGFDRELLRKAIRRRRRDTARLEEPKTLLDAYRFALEGTT